MRTIHRPVHLRLIAIWVFIIACLVFPIPSTAQFASPTVDGAITAGEYGTHTDGQNQQTSGGTIWYMTWDNTNLYVGISTANRTEGAVIYLDKDPIVPVNSGNNTNGTIGGLTYNSTNFAELQFRADLVIYVKNDSREYRTADGSGGWSGATAGFGSYSDDGNNLREFSISWSVIGGRPASFNWFGYITSSSGFVYGQVPTENAGGNIGTSARYARYYTVSTTADGSSTKPFSRNSYVFNSTSDISGFGALSAFDFTMNTASRILTRATSGNWTISGNMVVNNGTVQFTETNNTGGTTTITGDLTVSGGRLDQGKTNQDIVVGGNVSISGGTFQLSDSTGNLRVGGNWSRSGTFDPNGSIVEFNGTTAQTINNSTTFARFTVSNTTANVTLTGNQTIDTDINITGRFNLSTFNLNGASPLNVASGATLTLGSADGINSGTGAGNIRTSGTRTFNAGANYIFNGGAAQVTGDGFPVTVNNLTIDNAHGVTLSTATTANGTLTLTSGRLTLGSNNLTLGPSAPAVAGTLNSSNMVVADGSGYLCKRYGTISSYSYPIGDNDNTNGADYSPVTAVSVSGTGSGSPGVCFNVTDAVHPNRPVDGTTYISRYWTGTILGGSISGLNYGATFNFVSGETTGAASMNGKKWNGSNPWIELGAVSGTSFSAAGQTTFSDFTAFTSGPLSVTMSEIAARQDGNAIRVSWETASELNNRGFYVWRATADDAPQNRLNTQLIPSLAAGSPGGQLYSYSDAHDLVAGTTYYYWVEAVGTDGSTTFVGPLPVEYRVPTAVAVSGSSTTSAWRASIALLLAGGLTAAMLMAVGRKMAVRP